MIFLKIFRLLGIFLIVVLFSFKPKPVNDIETLNIGDISMNLNDIGELAVSNTGFNFMYNTQEFLQNPIFKTSLILGTSGTDVYDNFSNITSIKTYTEGNFQEITTSYEVSGKFSITQKVYAWNEANHQKYIIVEYQIKNIGTVDISQLYAGIFADWNIGNKNENKANWDNSRKLGYINPTAFAGKYAGLSLLTENSANYYAFDNDGSNSSLDISTSFSNSDKFQVLSNGISRPQAGVSGSGNDVSQILSASLLALNIGNTQTIAFAMTVGDDLTELQQQAENAQGRFKERKTSPTPVVEDAFTCESGGSAIIIPSVEEGTLYRKISKE